MKHISSMIAATLGIFTIVGCSQTEMAQESSFDAPSSVVAQAEPDTPEMGQFLYHYYPEAVVFFSPDRNLWFWRGAAYWGVGHILPGTYHITPEERVTVHLDTDKPYRAYEQVALKHPSRNEAAVASVDADSER